MKTEYEIRNVSFLRKVLWADVLLGGFTAVIGLYLPGQLSSILGLPLNLILVIAAVTLFYAVYAFIMAKWQVSSVQLLRLLVVLNWLWTLISVFLLFAYFGQARFLGRAFLVLQIVVVGGLAYLEGGQIKTRRRIPFIIHNS